MNNDHASVIREACDGWHVHPLASDPTGAERIFPTRSAAIAYLNGCCPPDPSIASGTTPRGADVVTPDENKIT